MHRAQGLSLCTITSAKQFNVIIIKKIKNKQMKEDAVS
jgi:hypothetical protein